MAVGHSIATNPADLFLNAKRALTPGLTFSTKRGETKIFITNVEKNEVFGDFYGKIVEI